MKADLCNITNDMLDNNSDKCKKKTESTKMYKHMVKTMFKKQKQNRQLATSKAPQRNSRILEEFPSHQE